MKKRVLRVLLVMFLMLMLLFLASCNGRPAAGEDPQDTLTAVKLVQTGTEGVDINIVQDNPPSLIYDQNELVAIVEVNNKGNYDLQPQQCFVQITGYDQNIIVGDDFSRQKTCADGPLLEGKNLYNTRGGQSILEFRAPYIELPLGIPEYSPPLNFLTCYQYLTRASPQVCLDPLYNQITPEQVGCNFRRSISMGGGQGGPVGVSYLGVNMVGSKAIFEINIQNYGSGTVLSPYSNLRQCGQAALSYADKDKVEYSVELTGAHSIDCKPRDRVVRMINNQGKIVCTANIYETTAFETPLLIDLNYNYIESDKRNIKILDTPE